MKKSDQLKQERTALVKKQGGLLETRSKENREFTEAESTEFRNLDTQIAELDKKIEDALMEERAAQRAAEVAGASGAGTSVAGEGRSTGEEKEKRSLYERVSIGRAIRYITTGVALDGAEKEMNDIAIEESRKAGVDVPENAKLSIPLSMLRAVAQTVTQDDGEYGGALVHNHAPRVQMPFAAQEGVMNRLGATRWTGLSGGDIPLPVVEDFSFAWLAETDAITPQKAKIDGPKLSPKRLGAAVAISNRLLIQSSVDVEAMIRQLLIRAYERAIDAAAINGSGASNQPLGILNNTNIPTGTGAAPQLPTKALVAELVSLLESVDATDDRLAFLSNPGLRYLLETTKVDPGSGRFLVEKLNDLIGYRYETSTLVPTLSGNMPLIFGDWSKLFIGEWGALSVLTDPYSRSLENSVQLVLNGHADVAIAQPTAFAVNKFFAATE